MTTSAGILLTVPGRHLDRRERYVLATFMTALGIPFSWHSEGGLLLGSKAAAEPALEVTVDTAELNQAFEHLSRIEETRAGKRDSYGRYPLASSAFAADLRCHVDGIFGRFAARIGDAAGRRHIPWQPAPVWPDGAPFAVCLTHDVDWTYKWHVRNLVGQLGMGGWRVLRGPGRFAGLRRIGRDVRSAWRRDNPYWNFAEIAGREQQYGFRSTFFFIADGKSQLDGDYSIHDPDVLNLLELLQSLGAEIGLHGSYLSFERPELLRQELDRLKSLVGEVLGSRQHFLRFDVQTTLSAHEALGLKYDSTMGFAEREGYRSGFSFPYYPYNFAEDRPYRVLEIPLTIMDATLSRYRNLNAAQAWLAAERQLHYVSKSGGCCTVLWHNNYFDDASFPGYGDVYWRMLDWIAENEGWATSAGEIWRWWHQRSGSTDWSRSGDATLKASATNGTAS